MISKVMRASHYDEFYIAGKEEAGDQIQAEKVIFNLVKEYVIGK